MNVPQQISHFDIAKSIPFIALGITVLLNFGTIVWFAATLSANLDRLTDKVLTLEQQYSSADREQDDVKTRVVRIEEQAKNTNTLLHEIRGDLRDLVKKLGSE